MPVSALPAMRAAIAYNAPAAAASDWWLSGGINAANCFGAWAAVGAASKASSLLDLNTSGNDLTETGTVTFSAVNGWSGWSGTSNYLSCTPGISGNSARTIIVRCVPSTNATAENIAAFTSTLTPGSKAVFAITPELCGRYNGGNNLFDVTDTNDLVFALTYDGTGIGSTGGVSGFHNGSSVSETANGGSGSINTGDGLIIGGFVSGGSAAEFSGTILAISIYGVELTPSEVAAVSTAMTAL